MKKILIAAMLSMALAGTVEAAAEKKEVTPQQQKMKDCNAEAKSKALKGDERKTFMKGCLSKDGAPAAAAPAAADKKTAQKEKMKTCNADAKIKALKGDERKKFMSDCLKAG